MTLFSNRELADLRAMDESAMADQVTIVSVTNVPDGGGAWTETTTSADTVGRLRKRGGNERYADRQIERGSYELVLPRTTEVSGTSRVIVAGQAYRVVFCPVLAEYDTARRIGLEEA